MSKVKTDMGGAATEGASSETPYGAESYADAADSELIAEEDGFDLESVGSRLWTAVLIRGMDKSVDATGKSAKSLTRYRAGQEPPLGVVANMAQATGLSVAWLVTGRVETIADADAAVMTFERELAELDGQPGAAVEEVKGAIRRQLALVSHKRNLLQRLSRERAHVTSNAQGEGPGGIRNAIGKLHDRGPTEGPADFPDDFRMIPRLDVHAAAGSGALVEVEDQVEMLAFRADWLRRRGINPLTAHVLTARGDSMEPTIRDGDILLVDTSIDRVMDNAIYVVVYAGRTLVKRVQLRLDGSVVLRSDNRELFEEETVPASEVPNLNVAGRVMWYGRSI